jgi:hypothetical protein
MAIALCDSMTNTRRCPNCDIVRNLVCYLPENHLGPCRWEAACDVKDCGAPRANQNVRVCVAHLPEQVR